MPDTIAITELAAFQSAALPEVPTATDEEILAYLRRSAQIAEIAALAEHEALILALCDRLKITVSDDELQSAGNAFRLQHQLVGAEETFAWLQQQRITAEAWTEGIRVKLLERKLKDLLFGGQVDSQYLNNRKEFKRVALSQILVRDRPTALKIVQALQAENASFCALAVEYGLGKQAKERGGFLGVHFLPKLLPEIVQAISQARAGEVIGPIQTKFGYHILRVEKWYPLQLDDSVRVEVVDALFQGWLQQQSHVPAL
ncbi:peptidylprolyl isomerase [Pantanalinema sp. GBBB05]|uniref:peptidylprolyl isomerase n=1 Tax=Pantanalinema sp. GBBB05 TaxID=2604139 RepID=UPI001D8E1788|nr:peptidylprolyl isomerase [Pantanalinema sp. GBBB05]